MKPSSFIVVFFLVPPKSGSTYQVFFNANSSAVLFGQSALAEYPRRWVPWPLNFQVSGWLSVILPIQVIGARCPAQWSVAEGLHASMALMLMRPCMDF
jgi:hypothetical protein